MSWVDYIPVVGLVGGILLLALLLIATGGFK